MLGTHRRKRGKACERPPLLEQIEPRYLMATGIWGAAPTLIRLNEVAAAMPSLDGTGQTVAVIDTGIDYNHPALGGGIGAGKKVIAGYDFHDDDEDPMDTDGHGTAVAGVIAADPFEAGGFDYRGIAPGAKLVALRISPDTALVSLSRIEEALQWVIANADTYNISIVNLSFGFGFFESNFNDPQLSNELAELANRDIVFVSSSGNAGNKGINYPAADPNAISVGSVNSSDVISEFTQRSRNLDLLAVGEGVRTTTLGGGFGPVTGTSFAAPAVAGAAALVRDVNSSFTLSDFRSMLRVSSAMNVDGDLEVGTTTGLTFQRLDLFSLVSLATQRQPIPSEQEWMIGVNGNVNSLAYDNLGALHFAWYDNAARTMKFSTRSLNGKWSSPITIDQSRLDVGTEFSLKVDSYGRPMMAYLDGPNGDLKFGAFEGGGWTTRVIDDLGVTGLYPTLIVDANDDIYISYYRKTKGDLKFAWNKGGVWNRQSVDTDGDAGRSATMTLDRAQRPAIAYGVSGGQGLKLARRQADDSWAISTANASDAGAAYLSLAFTEDNEPRISFYELSPADLMYASFSNNKWSTQRIATRGATGLYTNLQLDSNGAATILYWDRKSDAIHEAKQNGSRFQITGIVNKTGKYLVTARSPLNGRWTYAASHSPAGKLVVGQV